MFPFRWHHRIFSEYRAIFKVSPETLKDDDIRGNDQEGLAQWRPLLKFFMEVGPDSSQCHHKGLASAGGHLDCISCEVRRREFLLCDLAGLRNDTGEYPLIPCRLYDLFPLCKKVILIRLRVHVLNCKLCVIPNPLYLIKVDDGLYRLSLTEVEYK